MMRTSAGLEIDKEKKREQGKGRWGGLEDKRRRVGVVVEWSGVRM